jgi:hypothetical protein
MFPAGEIGRNQSTGKGKILLVFRNARRRWKRFGAIREKGRDYESSRGRVIRRRRRAK